MRVRRWSHRLGITGIVMLVHIGELRLPETRDCVLVMVLLPCPWSRLLNLSLVAMSLEPDDHGSPV